MTKQRIKFTFSAPEAKSVHIAGSFNHWKTNSDPLSQSKEEKASGTWSKVFYLEPGIYEYRFVVDDLWNNDAGSIEGWTNEFGSFNCVVSVWHVNDCGGKYNGELSKASPEQGPLSPFIDSLNWR